MEMQITITEKAIQEGIEKCISEKLKNSYDNPVNDAITAALKEKGGIIQSYVNELLTSAISNPEFKTKLGDMVLARMIELAVKK